MSMAAKLPTLSPDARLLLTYVADSPDGFRRLNQIEHYMGEVQARPHMAAMEELTRETLIERDPKQAVRWGLTERGETVADAMARGELPGDAPAAVPVISDVEAPTSKPARAARGSVKARDGKTAPARSVAPSRKNQAGSSAPSAARAPRVHGQADRGGAAHPIDE
jgi:hypothetical protein